MSRPGNLRARWEAGAHIGVGPMLDQTTHRRVVLVNQMAILALPVTLFYAIVAIGVQLLGMADLWPIAAITPPVLAGYAAVLWSNHRRRFLLARLFLAMVPAIQLSFASWVIGNGAGVHLYFFVLWTALFLLFTRGERWLSVLFAGLWISLFIWIQLAFNQPVIAMRDPAWFTDLAFFINAVGAFALLGGLVALFYQEINHTEDMLQREYQRSEELLRNILPVTVARRLKEGSQVIADSFPDATLLFADIVGFTELAGRLPPGDLVELLNKVFSRFDRIAEQEGLEKIKTIGDEYMLAGGLPLPRADHAPAVARAALHMIAAIDDLNQSLDHKLALRVGMHSGEVVAGVIGSRKFSFDVWGDTVNIASRMQSQGLPGRIQLTEATHDLLADQFHLERRGTLRVRGKGRMPVWFLEGTASPSGTPAVSA
ncbi:adenylate/guanylate cyclase domain-containing protein [Salinisphaera sp. P385]|uniref:Adenylate/guanylate cyclase domain-containing protein n=1 Tax=Spectribacter acetivorans TaxID=3075603 RepID=A0ABU3BAC1_9GAMM|nr:adenylate/guanylate cyclase domain-containing protein [Salinisphaera sp. P385]MDT0619417.1 adenylate/guanylate cyclase domain-containing protein [Salinisphaera sp. P385]